VKLKKVEIEASLSEIETLIKNTLNDIENAKKQQKIWAKESNKKKFKELVKEEIADKEEEEETKKVVNLKKKRKL
jgi:hypothetical protein